MNDRFQNARFKKAQNCPPIWFMRQAGRYHQHYQGMRKSHSFMELCKNPKLAAEVALGPVADFDFDVSILFSDILFPLEALGMGLKYEETGPELGWHLTPQNIANLKDHKVALPQLEFQREAMFETRKVLPKDKSLIGFIGGPWTLFTYAVEGSHKGNLQSTKSWMRFLFPEFCKRMIPLLVENIKLQLEGGAEVVMIFDTAAGELSPGIYSQLVLPQIQSLVSHFPNRIGYYSKGTTQNHIEALSPLRSQLAGIGADHRFNLSTLLKDSTSGFVQGNFDQAILFADKEIFLEELHKYLEDFKKLSVQERAGWVCGLGHGVLPKTPEENVRLFVKTVREVFR